MKLILLFLISLTNIQAQAELYGKIQPNSSDAITLAEAKSKIENGESPLLTIQAETDKVCKKKGCWMSIKDGDQSIRVKFKDYGFFVPKNYDNKKFIAYGKFIEKNVSEGDRKHYLKDAKASKKEIDAIKGSKKQLQFIASGVDFL